MEEEMDFENRILTPEYEREDSDIEGSLRPKTLQEYIGQEKAKENMSIYIEAARMRGEPLDHVLLYGPPGLGKTTLSGIIANEMNVNLRITSGPAIEKPGDLAALLTNLGENDILFIDEIHRLSRAVEYYHRQRPVSQVDSDRFAPFYTSRSHHPGRPADCAASRSVRCDSAPGAVYDRRTGPDYPAQCWNFGDSL